MQDEKKHTALTVFAEMAQDFFFAKRPSIEKTLAYLRANQDGLKAYGGLPGSLPGADWLGTPNWLYPSTPCLSDEELSSLDRHAILELKINAFELLRSVTEAGWLSRFQELLSSSTIKPKAAHYFLADQVYLANACRQSGVLDFSDRPSYIYLGGGKMAVSTQIWVLYPPSTRSLG